MNDKSKVGIGASLVAAAIAIIALVVSFRQAPPTVLVQPDGQQPFGALAGPDIPSNYLKWGNFEEFKGGVTMNTASSTLCAIDEPSATSTINFKAQITTATSSILTLVLEEAPNQYALPLGSATSSGSFGSRRRLVEWVIPSGTTPLVQLFATSTANSSDAEKEVVTSATSTSTFPRRLVLFATDGKNQISAGGTGQVFTGLCKAKFDVVGR